MEHRNLDLVWDNTAHNNQNKSVNSEKTLAEILQNCLARVPLIQGEFVVIKLSADIINCNEKLANFAQDIMILKSLDISIVVIHDYKDIMNDIAEFFDIKEKFSSPIMNHRSMHIVEMLIRHINQKITSAINAAGGHAVGISGKDCNMIVAKKYNVAAKLNLTNREQIIDMGFVSEPALVNPEFLMDMSNMIVVLSPIASGAKNESLLLDPNITASIISSALSASHLFFLDPDGGFRDDQQEIISEMKIENLKTLADQNRTQNLQEAAVGAIENYTENVHIIDSSIKHGILLQLFSDDPQVGTTISISSEESEDSD